MPAPGMNTHLPVNGYQPYPPRASTPLGPWTEGPPYAPGPEKSDPALQVQPYAPSVPQSGLYCPPDSATSPEPEPPGAPWASDDAKSPKKKPKARTSFTPEQLEALSQRFQAQHYLSPLQTREVAASLSLTCKQVKTWFQNRRMKFKRCQKESMWMMDKAYWLPQGGSWPAGGSDVPQHLPQGYKAHQPVGTVQRVASHPYQSYAGVPYTHQMLPEDRAARHQGESPQQSQGYQPTMDMYQNYSAMDYSGTWKGDAYNYASAPHYAFGKPYNYYQQQQLPYNHRLSRPHVKS
ncbi:uncharacterized protein LOC144766611 [Lissotriton helveticus]